jgi:hypothetical protein
LNTFHSSEKKRSLAVRRITFSPFYAKSMYKRKRRGKHLYN